MYIDQLCISLVKIFFIILQLLVPATLNPTSEIKVVNVNKIIKPDDQEKVAALKKESVVDKPPKTKPTARKRTAGPERPNLRKRTSRKKVIEFDDNSSDIGEEDEFLKVVELEEDDDDDEDNIPLKPPAKHGLKSNTEEDCMLSLNAKKDQDTLNNHTLASTRWSDDSEDEYLPDFDPADTDTDNEEGSINDFKLPLATDTIKQEFKEDVDDDDTDAVITSNIEIEPLADFEYSRLDSYTLDVKCEDEDENNLFDEKDRILEHLLNENDYTQTQSEVLNNANVFNKRKRSRKALESRENQDSDDILKETEVVYIKFEDNDNTDLPSEDILLEQNKVNLYGMRTQLLF